MINKKLPNQGISSRFTTDAIIMAGAPIVLTLIAIIAVWVAPKILHLREVDRCLELRGTFNDEKDECVVAKKETR